MGEIAGRKQGMHRRQVKPPNSRQVGTLQPALAPSPGRALGGQPPSGPRLNQSMLVGACPRLFSPTMRKRPCLDTATHDSSLDYKQAASSGWHQHRPPRLTDTSEPDLESRTPAVTMNIPPSLLASDDDAMSGFAYGDALWQDPGQLAIAQEHQSLSFFSPGFPEQQQQQQLQQQLPFYSQRPSISNSSASGSRSTPPPPPPPPAGRSSRQRHRNVRQGHTKSRNGCYNCKKRRIKVRPVTPLSLPLCESR